MAAPNIEKELKNFNIAAMCLTFIWGIFNGCFRETAIVLVLIAAMFTCYTNFVLLGILIAATILLCFYYGIMGNKWAYKNKRWRDDNHFIKTQQLWTILTVIFFLLSGLALKFGMFVFFSSMNSPTGIISFGTKLYTEPIIKKAAKMKIIRQAESGDDIAANLVAADLKWFADEKVTRYNQNSIEFESKSTYHPEYKITTIVSFYKSGSCSLRKENCVALTYFKEDGEPEAKTFFDNYGKTKTIILYKNKKTKR